MLQLLLKFMFICVHDVKKKNAVLYIPVKTLILLNYHIICFVFLYVYIHDLFVFSKLIIYFSLQWDVIDAKVRSG